MLTPVDDLIYLYQNEMITGINDQKFTVIDCGFDVDAFSLEERFHLFRNLWYIIYEKTIMSSFWGKVV